jgi:hypothetical protein
MKDHSWTWIISERGLGDWTKPIFSYSVDDEDRNTIQGEARRDSGTFVPYELFFGESMAKSFLFDVLNGKTKVLFAVGNNAGETGLELSSGLLRNDIEVLSRFCPIGSYR